MDKKWKSKTIMIGAVIGALAGAASALMFIKRSEDDDKKPEISAGEGIQVGLGLLGLMRLIAGFSSDS